MPGDSVRDLRCARRKKWEIRKMRLAGGARAEKHNTGSDCGGERIEGCVIYCLAPQYCSQKPKFRGRAWEGRLY